MNKEDQSLHESEMLRKTILELKQNHRLFKETEKAGKIGGWEFDPVSLKQNWTDEVFRILEIDMENGAPEVPKGLEFIDPEHRPEAEKAIQQAMELGEPYDQEWIITTDKGNKKWVNAVCNPKVKNGKVVAVSGSFQDITSRKLVEEELKKSEEKLRLILDNNPFPVAVVDERDNNILYLSNSAIQLFGHEPKTSEEWYELAYPNPEYRQEVVERWKPFLEIAQNSPKAVNTGEYQIHCKNGSIKICELYAQFIPGSLVVTFNDITVRKNAESLLYAQNQQLVANEQQLRAANQQLQASEQQLRAANQQLQASEQQLRAANQQLQASEQQLRAANRQLTVSEAKIKKLFDNVDEAIFRYNPKSFEIYEANSTTSDLYGYSNDELIGMSCLKFSAELEESKSVAKAIINNDKINISYRHHKKKDGKDIFVELTTLNIQVEGENFVYGVCHDITERIKAENELKKHRDHLDKLVKERTAEIEEKNIKLDEQMKIFVGRELRINKLEKEVRQMGGEIE